MAVVPGAGSEHCRASARRLRQRGRRPRDAAGRADVAGGERIGERRARGAPAASPSCCSSGAAAGAGENERARSGAAVAGRARRVAAALRRQVARVVPAGRSPDGRIARRRRLGGPGRRGGGGGRGGRAQAQRRDRRAEIRKDVGFPVRLVPGALVERERCGAEAHPVSLGHPRSSVAAADTGSSAPPDLPSPTKRRRQAYKYKKKEKKKKGYTVGEQGQLREEECVCVRVVSAALLCSLQPRTQGEREGDGAQLQLQLQQAACLQVSEGGSRREYIHSIRGRSVRGEERNRRAGDC